MTVLGGKVAPTPTAGETEILHLCGTPHHHANSRFSPPLEWRTWSPSFRSFLTRCLESDANPYLTRIGDAAYDHSYTVDLVGQDELATEARETADALRSIELPVGACLLQGLLDDGVTRASLHLALASLRAAICNSAGSDHAALHAQLGQVGGEAGAFLLHSDLYAAEMLLLIYDDIPDDGSGELLLLHRDRFVFLLNQCGAPERVRAGLTACLEENCETDRFDEFYDSLYGPRPWTEWRQRLVAAMHDDAYRIAMRRGEGILLDDRRWLHGRSRPTGGVSPWRLHRLAFTPTGSERQS